MKEIDEMYQDIDKEHRRRNADAFDKHIEKVVKEQRNKSFGGRVVNAIKYRDEEREKVQAHQNKSRSTGIKSSGTFKPKKGSMGWL